MDHAPLRLFAAAGVLAAQAPLIAQGAPLQGEVVSARSGRGIPGVVVSVQGVGAAVGDGRGRFVLDPAPQGLASVTVVAPGHVTLRLEVDFAALDGPWKVSLDPVAGAATGDVVVVEGRAEYSDPVVQVISVDEMQSIPGSFGDAIRAVQNLPGVARASFGTGALIVRGTEPEDTGVYIDGIRVPQLFHFGALTTVINSDMLDEVRFLPGGYGVRFGRNLGGVVDVVTSAVLPQDPGAYADVDLLDATAYFALPIGEYGGLRGSVRRSYLDLVLSPFLDLEGSGRPGGPGGEGGGAAFQLPVYDDYQLVYDTAIGDRHRLHLVAFGARDSFEIVGGETTEEDGSTSQDSTAGLSITNHKGLARWTFVPNARVTHQLTVAVGPDTNEFSVGALDLTNNPLSFFFRDDLYLDVGDHLRARVGVDALAQDYTFSLSVGSGFSQGTGQQESSVPSLEGSPLAISVAPWAEVDVIAGPVTLTPGVRLDGHLVRDDSGEEVLADTAASVDPRLAARWRLGPETSVRGSVGRYSNGADPFALFPEFNPEGGLTLEYAIQSTLGIDHRFSEGVSVQGSLYEGELRDLLVGGGGRQPDLSPGGAGSNYGAELLLRVEPGDSGRFGWVSYTAQRSLRNDDFANACPRFSEGESGCSEWYLFDSDQTHILTVVGSQKLPHGFEVGARFRYTTGNPYTPVVGSTYDVDRDTYVPINGELNSERLPAFHQLDLRVDKRWQPRWGEFTATLEILNVYNRSNPEYLLYNFDYTETDYVEGIPFFPSLGFKAKF